MHIRGRARDHHFSEFDLLGIAPPGTEDSHYLAGVTRFKQSF
jgi:lipid II:glycine glycyltransferase (peptidoglycan interpeptide bridge formation enzyme)